MNSALNYCVLRDVETMVLNTIYAIFLGLLFTFFFEQEVNNGAVTRVHFLVSQANWLPVISLSTYFVLDWLTTNLTVTIKGEMNHWLLMSLILLISYLGGLVVLAFEPRITLYFWFGLYASIVPWWDLLVQAAEPGERTLGRAAITYTAIVSRAVVGLFMLGHVGLTLWLGKAPSENLLRGLLAVYVVLKFARYLIYVDYDLVHREALISK